VKADAIAEKFTAQASKLDAITPVVGQVEPGSAKGYLLDDRRNSSLYALFGLLSEGVKAYRLTGPGHAPGTIYIPRQSGLSTKLAAATKKFAVDFKPTTDAVAGSALKMEAPRVGLYKSWIASLDEGWTRFIFEKNGIAYKTVVDADIRKGNLK
jgi:hypothetical protein